MNSTTKIHVTDLNPHLVCVLCGGYLIDATTVIECIHSFCRTCIIRYLESSKYCPICDVQVHKTRPLVNVRSDKTLQTLVYKLVPGLFKDEMRRRREFYAANPDKATLGPTSSSVNVNEERGQVKEEDDVSTKSDDEKISLCLQRCNKLPPYNNESLLTTAPPGEQEGGSDRRYLLCPSGVTIGHLKKLLRIKFELPPSFRLDVFYSDESLRDVYTLLDVAHIYAWRRMEPLKLFYIIYDQTIAQLHLTPPSVKDTNRILPDFPTGKKRKTKPKLKTPSDIEEKRRKIHDISSSDTSDVEIVPHKNEDVLDNDSGVIVISTVDSDAHMDDEIRRSDDSTKPDVEISNERTADPSLPVVHIQFEAVAASDDVVNVTTVDSAGTVERPQGIQPLHSNSVTSSDCERSSSAETVPPEVQSVTCAKTSVEAAGHTSHVTVSSSDNGKPEADVTRNGHCDSTVRSPESNSEQSKSPKSKNINDIVSKIKAKNVTAKTDGNSPVPNIVPLDLSKSDNRNPGNENKQPIPAMKKIMVVSSVNCDALKGNGDIELVPYQNGGNTVSLVPEVVKKSYKKKPKSNCTNSVQTKTKLASDKLSTCLQDSLVGGNNLPPAAKPKRPRKPKKAKADDTVVDLNMITANQRSRAVGNVVEVEVTFTNGAERNVQGSASDANDIEIIAIESTDSTGEPVVIIS